MDLHLRHTAPTDDERAAVDALLGTPDSAWDGGERGGLRDAHTAYGGRAQRERRHLLLPALRALQARVGWISETGLEYVCTRLGVPPADAWGVATFYALLSTTPRPRRVVHVCDDVACRFRGADGVMRKLESTLGPAHVHDPASDHVDVDPRASTWLHSPCLGLCDHAPAAFVQEFGVELREYLATGEALTAADTTVIPQQGNSSLRLLRRVGVVDAESITEFRHGGGFEALRHALEIGPSAVIQEMIASRLMGRGGAAFPTGKKWEAVAQQPARPHYLICNADESEPGTFKDRVLLDGDPFAIVEAMT
ncbi:MAG TPA: NAD(P)H-dependent oxidoreductase subunit E, partial [Gemmatimonadaceae bacterium]